jgi:hypothetical protein
MKSNKQRRAELAAKREVKRKQAAKEKEAREAARRQLARKSDAKLGIAVDTCALAHDNSYSIPDFVTSGYYVDIPFRCRDCGKNEVWTATQQKWWYEVAKGGRWTTAIRCRSCRRRERQRVAKSRSVHLEGIARKVKK